jgi:hypothetical protein
MRTHFFSREPTSEATLNKTATDLCASAGSMQGACYSDMCAIGGNATSQISDGYQTALATSTELASIAAGHLYARRMASSIVLLTAHNVARHTLSPTSCKWL